MSRKLNVLPQDEGVDINLLDGDDATPLHFAASRGHSDTVSTDTVNHRYTLSLSLFSTLRSTVNVSAM